MTIEQLSSVIYNNVVSGLSGMDVNNKFSLDQIADDIVNERLVVIKEYSLKGILPAKDLMMTISPIQYEDTDYINNESVYRFFVPQIAFDYYDKSIDYIGYADNSKAFKVYRDRNAWLRHKYRLAYSKLPYVFIDSTPNDDGLYTINIIIPNGSGMDSSDIKVVAIWKDPRQMHEFNYQPEEINNWTALSNDIIKRLTEKYIRYYRQLAFPPTNTDLNYKA